MSKICFVFRGRVIEEKRKIEYKVSVLIKKRKG